MSSDKSRDVTEATSLPEAILLLNRRYGSDAKTAAALGMNANGRFTVMRWRQGESFPEPEYRERLARVGVPPRLLIPPATVEELWKTQRRLEADAARLRAALEELVPEPH